MEQIAGIPWPLVGLALAVVCVTILVELVRWSEAPPIDALRIVSVVYLLAYGVVPISLVTMDYREFRMTTWAWLLQFDLHDQRFALGAALGLVAYLTCVSGHRLTLMVLRQPGVRPPLTSADSDSIARWAKGLALVGATALVVYTVSIGGVIPLILQAGAFRTRPPVITPWAFLKNVAPLTVAAAFILAGLVGTARRPSMGLRVWAGLTWIAAFITLFHRAARIPLLAFLLTVPLAGALRRRRFPVTTAVAGGVLFVAFVLFGKQVFGGGGSTAAIESRWDGFERNTGYALKSVLIEFAFPFASAGNIVETVPELSPYRYFADWAIAPLYLVPQRLSGVTPPPMVSAIHTELMNGSGTLPADIVTLGYFSLGLPGVLVTGLLFGLLLGLVDQLVVRRLPASGPLGVLGLGWTLFAGFTSLYSDPQMVLESGFYLYVATLTIFWLRRGSSHSSGESPRAVAAPVP